MDEFPIKRNDLLPALEAVLSAKQADGSLAVEDLTGKTVFFILYSTATGANVFRRAATVVGDATAGRVRYQWQTGDTGTAGRYKGEFEVLDGSSRPKTFPNDDYIPIRIFHDLG